MTGLMEEVFRTGNSRCDKFRSRLFGLFNEEVARHWAADPRAPYEDLGRPTLRWQDDPKWHTLDFTLRRRSDGAVFVTEMKCELEFEEYRYLRLVAPGQVAHHEGSEAFRKFLAVAADPSSVDVRVSGRTVGVDGGILVWGATTPEGEESTADHYRLETVLSVEDMLVDLQCWGSQSWEAFVGELRRWSVGLLNRLSHTTEPTN